MELYKKSDIKIIDENIDKIIEDIENIRRDLFPRPRDNIEPQSDESDKEKEKKNAITI